MISGCETAITAADQFAERLTAELSVLDGDNIHSMMASEEAVDNLMMLLTSANYVLSSITLKFLLP